MNTCSVWSEKSSNVRGKGGKAQLNPAKIDVVKAKTFEMLGTI